MTVEQARSFILEMAERIGMGFHVDTPFGDYEHAKGERMFGDSTTPIFNAKMETAIDVLTSAGVDPYVIVMDQWIPIEMAQ